MCAIVPERQQNSRQSIGCVGPMAGHGSCWGVTDPLFRETEGITRVAHICLYLPDSWLKDVLHCFFHLETSCLHTSAFSALSFLKEPPRLDSGVTGT